MIVKGMNGQVSFDDNCVVIARKGFFGAITRNETVRIPMERLSYIQLVKPFMLTNGYVHFVMPGSPEINDVNQALRDSSCVVLNPKQYKHMVILKEEIELNMVRSSDESMSSDVLTSLEKLASLKERGILSEKEFQKEKTNILNRK